MKESIVVFFNRAQHYKSLYLQGTFSHLDVKMGPFTHNVLNIYASKLRSPSFESLTEENLPHLGFENLTCNMFAL